MSYIYIQSNVWNLGFSYLLKKPFRGFIISNFAFFTKTPVLTLPRTLKKNSQCAKFGTESTHFEKKIIKIKACQTLIIFSLN